MASVYYYARTNSTHFTTCCDVAILERQQKCPSCGVDVYPFHSQMTEKERDEAAGGYNYSKTCMARDNEARRRFA